MAVLRQYLPPQFMYTARKCMLADPVWAPKLDPCDWTGAYHHCTWRWHLVAGHHSAAAAVVSWQVQRVTSQVAFAGFVFARLDTFQQADRRVHYCVLIQLRSTSQS